jgi:hypothetical protein
MMVLATYALGRHAFQQYLTELEALRLELQGSPKYYKPYFDNVYRATYPSVNCIERSVASFWTWYNSEINSPAALRDLFKAEIMTWAAAFAQGGNQSRDSATGLEDKLVAQVNQCSVNPVNPPEIWGLLPSPHQTKWTRYNHVPWMMDRSAGGNLASILNAGPVRKTIAIHHVP